MSFLTMFNTQCSRERPPREAAAWIKGPTPARHDGAAPQPVDAARYGATELRGSQVKLRR